MQLEEVVKKLALWHTPTFRPIMSHDDLEPILCSVGFISLPADPPSDSPSSTSLQQQQSSPIAAPSPDVRWKEYDFPSAAASAAAVSGGFPPRPRLPFPMIYGLHLIAYAAFLRTLECYIGPTDVYNLFHVRAMACCPLLDEDFEKNYRPMKNFGIDDGRLYAYRKGTIFNYMFEQITALDSSDESEEEDDRNHSNNGADQIIMVSLDDILPERNEQK
ncbi:uncharacterized protein LOC110023776 [Phalaenopsis equestris]|uniref:uncharacterized protein LOC110023776 n=1 Tax=Phalaenopsis equestris TaxID=78828 RepID=UPI0009E1D235|nr:uncharacterized protein LOC110023776 [Phalaenopsis equestris]